MTEAYLRELHESDAHPHSDIGAELYRAEERAELPPALMKRRTKVPEQARTTLRTLSSLFAQQQEKALDAAKGESGKTDPTVVVRDNKLGIQTTVKKAKDVAFWDDNFKLTPGTFRTKKESDLYIPRLSSAVTEAVEKGISRSRPKNDTLSANKPLPIKLEDIETELINKGLTTPIVVRVVKREESAEGSFVTLGIRLSINRKVQPEIQIEVSRNYILQPSTTTTGGGKFETDLHAAITALPDVDETLEDTSHQVKSAVKDAFNEGTTVSNLNQRVHTLVSSLAKKGISVKLSALKLVNGGAVSGTIELRYEGRTITFNIEESDLEINSAIEKTK